MTPGALGARRGLLAAVLDTLVPPSGAFPGAGTAALDHVLAAATSAGLEALLAAGLDAVERAAPGDFAALSPEDRERVLRDVEAARPEFLDALLRETYTGYYSHAAVVALLGLDPRPLHPRGHPIEPMEMRDLGRVVGRGPLYRQA